MGEDNASDIDGGGSAAGLEDPRGELPPIKQWRKASDPEFSVQGQGRRGGFSPSRVSNPGRISRAAASFVDLPSSPGAHDGGVKDSEEDRRRRFLKEKRMREEAQRQEDFDRAQDEEEERKSAELARLDSRRMAIRLRIQEQHEAHTRVAEQRCHADLMARANVQKFKSYKPLYERLQQEFEKRQVEHAKARRDEYDALQPMRLVRPGQIISGEVKLVPLGKPRRSLSVGPRERSPSSVMHALPPRRSLAGQQDFLAKPHRKSIVLPAVGSSKKHLILVREAGETDDGETCNTMEQLEAAEEAAATEAYEEAIEAGATEVEAEEAGNEAAMEVDADAEVEAAAEVAFEETYTEALAEGMTEEEATPEDAEPEAEVAAEECAPEEPAADEATPEDAEPEAEVAAEECAPEEPAADEATPEDAEPEAEVAAEECAPEEPAADETAPEAAEPATAAEEAVAEPEVTEVAAEPEAEAAAAEA
ncbi:MAG: hypothetical protein WDW38_001115 [Sanguina aurantia]